MTKRSHGRVAPVYEGRMLRARLLAGGFGLALASAAPSAFAEGGFALNRLEPAPAGDVFVAVPSPFASGHLDVYAHSIFDYADKPIRTRGDKLLIVSSQAFVRVDASLALFDRVSFSVGLPFAVLQQGDATGIAGTTFTTLEAPAAGDLRLGVRARLLGDDAGPFQLGLGGYVFAPTGSAEQYTSEGSVRVAPYLALGGRVGESVGFAYSVSGGAELHAGDAPHALRYGAAAALLLGRDTFQVGPEVFGATPVGDGRLSLSATPASAATEVTPATNLELLVTAKVRFLRGFTIGAGVGPGLLSAIGTPSYRAVAMLGWAPLATRNAGEVEPSPDTVAKKPGDGDDDGIRDDIDACPEEPGEPNPDPKRDGCPPSDRDADGVLDSEDACPGEGGERSAEVETNGCPPDSDGDGIADDADACPAAPGARSEEPAVNGCVADGDGDGVADARDACPQQKGAASNEPSQDGCPAQRAATAARTTAPAGPRASRPSAASGPGAAAGPSVTVTEGEILIDRQVLYLNDGEGLGETVSRDSYELLVAVKAAILGDSSIALVEVQGHTDDNGSEEYNLALSQRRAESVMRWLVAGGVPQERVTAKGYGFEHPVADNRHKKGRQLNRRVAFIIAKRNK